MPISARRRRGSMVRRLIAPLAMATVLSLGFAGPAVAQPLLQTGLVNIVVGDVTIQVPVAVAANICDVNVAALVGDFRDEGSADCDSQAMADAGIEDAVVTPGPPTTPIVQLGLVNVIIGDVTAQVPIAAALNVCDVNLAILVGDFFDDGNATCTADADSGASG
jgi:hypothetical protein